MSLSDRILFALKEQNLSQSQLARLVGVKSPSVNAWVSGKTKTLEGENLLRAAAALGVNANWLATGRGLMRPTDLSQDQREHAANCGFTKMAVPNELTPMITALLSLHASGVFTERSRESLTSFANSLNPNINNDLAEKLKSVR